MYGEKAITLIKELDRNRDTVPPYQSDSIKEISVEIKKLVSENQEDANQTDMNRSLQGMPFISSIRVRHAAIKRNIRCLIAYHYNRLQNLRTMRWQFGSVLPAEVQVNLSAAEGVWFSKYSTILGQYMRTIGDEGGLNLAVDLHPPKTLCIEVKCLTDYGHYELSDGSIVVLKKDSRHFLPRTECEEFIRQGVFEHVS